MVCPSCGKQTPEESRLCLSCGAFLPETPRPNPLSARNVSTVLAIVIALASLGFYFAGSRREHDLWASGVAGRTFELVIGSPRAREALGTPIRQTGAAKGQAWLAEEGGYAQAAVPVGGPKATGKVYVVANRDANGWQMEAVSLVLDGGGKTLDLTPPPKPSRLIPRLHNRGEVELLPLGTEEAALLQTLPAYYDARFGVRVKVLPARPPDPSVLTGPQRILVAEKLIDLLERSDPGPGPEPRTLIAVTARPMEIAGFDVPDAINYWSEDGFAVVSLARLKPRAKAEAGNPAILLVRLRKAVTRDIGRLYYALPLSRDRTSVLSFDISSAQAVDRMGESFLTANGVWVPTWMEAGPCVSILHRPGGIPVWQMRCLLMPPADTKAEVWQNDITLGMFVQQQTDFAFGRPFPLARVYRPRDNATRTFGIGTSDTLDIFLVGEMGRWVDLILADGGRVHFRRNWWKFYEEEYPPVGSGSKGSAMLRWNGERQSWSLKLRDGWTMIFPSSHDARRSQQAALIGMTDDRGRGFRFRRDAEGNLLRFATPTGYQINFRYDDHLCAVEASDTRGRTVRYAYDTGDRLIRVEDSAGRSEGYSYNARDQMTQVTNAAGQPLLTNEYDEAGWLVRQQLPDGRIFRYRYDRDSEGNLRFAEFIDPEGCATSFEFAGGSYSQGLPECPEKQPSPASAPPQ
jgi:YD repeat-containing protein